MRKVVCGVAFGVLASIGWPAGVSMSASQKPTPPVLTDSLVGSDLYRAYCANCHGSDGKGHGPVADVLKVPPADLTTLTRRHSGKYPAALVRDTLNGARVPTPSIAHGTSEMPLWGSIFRQLDSKESVAKVRVENLVKYVESIQVP
ncbi:MAG TPA: c-type cytochrome [Vicinamibacterales bacterium]|jgi:mono/diheme cytochrome c family protein